MHVGVIGFGHFASVVAQCLAHRGHTVSQYDDAPHLLRHGQRPVQDEPGFAELRGGITILSEPSPLAVVDVLWIAYDVPLTATGAPDIGDALARVRRLDALLPPDLPFLMSCQWPVGTTALACRTPRPVFYVMENVRVGRAIADFLQQPVTVVGSRDVLTDPLRDLLGPTLLTTPASAEMAKHTTNAFLALQIAFINEIQSLCAVVGADASATAAAVRSDPRISANAPLHPGAPFGGGSLQRDLLVLNAVAETHGLVLPILAAILPSNCR